MFKLIKVVAVLFSFGFELAKASDSQNKPNAELFNPKVLAAQGGDTTVFTDRQDAYSLVAPNASKAHRKDFVIGNSLFNENWIASPSSVPLRHGLGPTFNAQSCSACHFKDGRGAPPENATDPIVSLLFRISMPAKSNSSNARDVQDVPGYGDQFQPKGIRGVPGEVVPKIQRKLILGQYPDGSAYELEQPTYSFEELTAGPLPSNIQVSPRVAPAVFGVGLLESIKDEDIIRQQDADDKNQDGVSGRANFVHSLEKKSMMLGRFGWKSNQPTVAQQNFSAFLGDMGITSPLTPKQNCPSGQSLCRKAHASKVPEIDASSLDQVHTYTRILAVPAARNTEKPAFQNGLQSFRSFGCISCHTESYTTGLNARFPELSNQKIRPYSDLLLHDMGPELADNRPDGKASGQEWRTPPLWGVGLVPTVNQHSRYLHDGRARSLEEAILWHGGEGLSSLEKFKTSAKTTRSDLIYFLESL